MRAFSQLLFMFARICSTLFAARVSLNLGYYFTHPSFRLNVLNDLFYYIDTFSDPTRVGLLMIRSHTSFMAIHLPHSLSCCLWYFVCSSHQHHRLSHASARTCSLSVVSWSSSMRLALNPRFSCINHEPVK